MSRDLGNLRSAPRREGAWLYPGPAGLPRRGSGAGPSGRALASTSAGQLQGKAQNRGSMGQLRSGPGRTHFLASEGCPASVSPAEKWDCPPAFQDPPSLGQLNVASSCFELHGLWTVVQQDEQQEGPSACGANTRPDLQASKVTRNPKEKPPWGSGRARQQEAKPVGSYPLPLHFSLWPPLVLFALAWGTRPQLPGQGHAFRVVKTPGPGVAVGNELSKSLSCEEPGSGAQAWLVYRDARVPSQAWRERLARGRPKAVQLLGTQSTEAHPHPRRRSIPLPPEGIWKM